MIPWELLDQRPVEKEHRELSLYRRGDEYSIRIGPDELMNSKVFHSERALAEETCARLRETKVPRLLIGGLGMGYTVEAALKKVGPRAKIDVAEYFEQVVDWNYGIISELAGHALDDERVKVLVGDVAAIIRSENDCYDAIMLDVDNGPTGLTRKANNWLYSLAGLQQAYQALRPSGILSVWSAGTDSTFTRRLNKAGFNVTEESFKGRGKKGPRHVIWFAQRPMGRKKSAANKK